MSMNRSHIQSVIAIVCAFGATAPLAAQRAIARGPALSPAATGLNGYSIVFVVGDTEPTGTSDAVPAAAQKALNDMKDFLPYRHYHLLDSAWILCCTDFGEPVTGRIVGQDGREYQYSIRTNPADAARFSIHFSLVPAGSIGSARGVAARGGGASSINRPEYSTELSNAIKNQTDARAALIEAQRRVNEGVAAQGEVQAAQASIQLAEIQVARIQALMAGRGAGATVPTVSIMDNSFYIAVGETVVIGTSRISGGQALVALLTAVPRSARKN